MKKYILLAFLFLSLLSFHDMQAQDIHFSQHFHTPMYVNPSFNGLSPGMSRFSLNAKNQWLAARSPYQSFLSCFDNSWKINRSSLAFFSTSAMFYYDVAGDADFSTAQFSPSFAYTFLLNNTFNSMLSFGIQPGIVQRSLDLTKLRFDAQYNGYFYDPTLPTNEIVDNQTFVYPDITAGMYYINFFDMNTFAGGGIALSHINKPVVSLKNSDEIRLDPKLTVHGEARMYIKNNVVLPTLYFAKQGPHTELLLGGRMVINQMTVPAIEQNIMFRKNFLLGLYYRGLDALIVYAGAEFQNYNFGITYDVNLSRFTPATNTRGGVEISAAYVWQKSKRHRNKDIPCPIF